MHSRLYSVFTPSIPMLDEMPEDEECMDFLVDDELETNQRGNENLFIHLHRTSDEEDHSTPFEDRAQIGNSKAASSSSTNRTITVDKHDLSPMDETKPTTNTNGWWNFLSLKGGFGNSPESGTSSTGVNIPIPNSNQSRKVENWEEVNDNMEREKLKFRQSSD